MRVRQTPSQATETPISFKPNFRSDFTKILIPLGLLIIFVITIAAAELALAIAIILRIYRNKNSVNVDEMNILKG